MLLEANGAPTRGRRRCYHSVVAMLQAVGAGVATGTGATKMPATMVRVAGRSAISVGDADEISLEMTDKVDGYRVVQTGVGSSRGFDAILCAI